MPSSCSPTRFNSESAEPSSSTSVPGCAARISSENRSVANWCSEPLAFSTANVTSPRRPYGFRSSRAGTGTGAGREPPPHAAAEQSVSNAGGRPHGGIRAGGGCWARYRCLVGGIGGRSYDPGEPRAHHLLARVPGGAPGARASVVRRFGFARRRSLCRALRVALQESAQLVHALLAHESSRSVAGPQR